MVRLRALNATSSPYDVDASTFHNPLGVLQSGSFWIAAESHKFLKFIVDPLIAVLDSGDLPIDDCLGLK